MDYVIDICLRDIEGNPITDKQINLGELKEKEAIKQFFDFTFRGENSEL